jgi:hypothetical protein
VVTNNSGATSDGINVNTSGPTTLIGNTCYNNGRDNISFANNASLGTASTVRNNLLSSPVRYNFNGYSSAAGWGKFSQWDGNAYYLGSGSANRNDADDTGTTNAVNAANPYSNSLDVILSADPFTNAGSHDFTLNSTAGGGASAKGTATPGALPGLSQTGSMSFGAFMPAAAGGASSSFVESHNIVVFDRIGIVGY